MLDFMLSSPPATGGVTRQGEVRLPNFRVGRGRPRWWCRTERLGSEVFGREK